MGRGLRLARIGGVDVFLDWSLLLIFGLVTVALGSGLFPQWHPEWSAPTIWATALGAAVLFFTSVLVHELSHAWVGRAQGVEISRITLFVFGGMAHIEQEPRTWRAELWMAIVGPITSLAIGIVCVLLGAQLAGSAAPAAGEAEAFFADLGPVATLLFWLGPVNIVLALFNLVPGFPLDGGRVLRAVLWGATGDLRRATRWASNGGRGFAWLLIGCGVAMILGFSVPVFGAGTVNGVWLALIGWFLHTAAVGSYRQLLVSESLGGVACRDVMQTQFETVPPRLSVSEFVDGHLLRSEQRAYPVVDDAGRLAGLVCLEDIRGLPRSDWDTTPLSSVLTGADDVVTIASEAPAMRALDVLNRRGFNQLPVVDGGDVCGIVSRSDVLRWLTLYAGADAGVAAPGGAPRAGAERR